MKSRREIVPATKLKAFRPIRDLKLVATMTIRAIKTTYNGSWPNIAFFRFNQSRAVTSVYAVSIVKAGYAGSKYLAIHELHVASTK